MPTLRRAPNNFGLILAHLGHLNATKLAQPRTAAITTALVAFVLLLGIKGAMSWFIRLNRLKFRLVQVEQLEVPRRVAGVARHPAAQAVVNLP